MTLLYTREPGLTYSQVRARLFYGADWWGPAHQFGYGKLNAYYTLVPRLTATIYGPSRIESGGDIFLGKLGQRRRVSIHLQVGILPRGRRLRGGWHFKHIQQARLG